MEKDWPLLIQLRLPLKRTYDLPPRQLPPPQPVPNMQNGFEANYGNGGYMQGWGAMQVSNMGAAPPLVQSPQSDPITHFACEHGGPAQLRVQPTGFGATEHRQNHPTRPWILPPLHSIQ
jgi:hypothetical protein